MLELNNAGRWKAVIEKPVWSDRLDFYMVCHHSDGVRIMQPDGCAYLVKEGCSRPANLKPTFSLLGFESRQMMFAIAEALAEEGIKGSNDHTIRGQFEAQSAHLQDLRTLLKLNKPRGDKK